MLTDASRCGHSTLLNLSEAYGYTFGFPYLKSGRRYRATETFFVSDMELQ